MPQSPTVLSRNPLSTIPMQSAYPSRTLIETPCVDVCEVDEATGLCIGCRRSLAEIAAWGAMSANTAIVPLSQSRGRVGWLASVQNMQVSMRR